MNMISKTQQSLRKYLVNFHEILINSIQNFITKTWTCILNISHELSHCMHDFCTASHII